MSELENKIIEVTNLGSSASRRAGSIPVIRTKKTEEKSSVFFMEMIS
ncbi:hypothetical protein SAMN05192588_2742 [Nonlabens sp. Hel1_33_55]|nr:hypothetical protein SAMN05192588_2742 [Nonlabens sp. Hel1_33_55]